MEDERAFRFTDPDKHFSDSGEAAVEFEERILILESAHAALTLSVARTMGDVLGWRDDDITAFLRNHADEVRNLKDRITAPLAPGPLPDLLDRVARDLQVK